MAQTWDTAEPASPGRRCYPREGEAAPAASGVFHSDAAERAAWS